MTDKTELQDVVNTIIRDCCESEVSDPARDDTIMIREGTLREILERALRAQPSEHGAKDAGIELSSRETFVPCDCGCGRSCCAHCGVDVGFIVQSNEPQGVDTHPEVVRLRQLFAASQEQVRILSDMLERNQAHHDRMMKLSAPAGKPSEPQGSAVVWPPRAMRGDGYVTIGLETLPMMSDCPACHADEAGTWNRCLDECQRATANARGIGGYDAQRLARWMEIHYRDGGFPTPELREIHAALLGATAPAGNAGGECQHEWRQDSDVMNARYCPKCDVTQTIPRKPTLQPDSPTINPPEVDSRLIGRVDEPVAVDRSEAYDKIDSFLRDTLMDAAYAEYSEALETIWAAPVAQSREVEALESLCAWLLHRFGPDSPEGREAACRLAPSQEKVS